MDEAHSLCPAEPRGTVQTATVDRLVHIAAEGRTYGLRLLLSTQRPSRIHPQVLSRCDDLALMRMSSPSDVAALATVFGRGAAHSGWFGRAGARPDHVSAAPVGRRGR